MSDTISPRATAILLAGAATLLPWAAAAQDRRDAAAPTNDGQTLPETIREDGAVIVTAPRFVPGDAAGVTKTDAPLVEIPQSISVVSRDQIDLLNFIDVQQAVRYTAGIVGENYGPDLRFDFLTQRGFIPVQFIDGLQAPISSTIANTGVDLYGFQSVQILRGPAATLYGTTPPGGIYDVMSRRPSATTGGEVQLKYGSDDFKQAAGTVTGALADGVTARLTGLYRDRDSQTDFVNQKRGYVAPAVSVDLGASTRLTGLGYWQSDKVRGDTNGFLPYVGVAVANPAGTVSRSVNLGEPDYNFYRRHQWGAGFELEHRFSPDLVFTSNARWGEYHEYQQIIYGAALGADDRTVTRYNFPFKDDVAQVAVDNRLNATLTTGAARHDLVGGFDYRNYREASAYAFALAGTIDLFDPVHGRTATNVPVLTPFTNQRLIQRGLYLQDQARLGPVILTLGGRQDWTVTNDYGAFASVRRAEEDRFTWRIGGTWVTEAGLAPYVSYSTSFQPVIGQTAGNVAFRPTEGRQYESGVKYDARGLSPDLKLFATAALFHIDQTDVLTNDPTNANFQLQTGEVVSKGAELEAVLRFRRKLSLNASYTYTDARVTRSNVAAQVGARLAAQPMHKASLFVDYTKSTGFLAGLGGGGGIRYLSENPGALLSAFDASTYTTQAVTLFDAQLHYDIPGWRLAVNGSNIFDRRYAARCSGSVGCFFGQSAQVIATLTKRF